VSIYNIWKQPEISFTGLFAVQTQPQEAIMGRTKCWLMLHSYV